MKEYKRKITREQYLKAQNGDFDGIFSQAETCGYGVYSVRLREENGEYYVLFEMGDSCD